MIKKYNNKGNAAAAIKERIVQKLNCICKMQAV